MSTQNGESSLNLSHIVNVEKNPSVAFTAARPRKCLILHATDSHETIDLFQRRTLYIQHKDLEYETALFFSQSHPIMLTADYLKPACG
eukprot:scaffold2501_cov174-Amphora_coffeaeformis.AAC.2